MRYLGGKVRLSKPISELILKRTVNRQVYYEPFCGSCNVTSKIAPHKSTVYASDNHVDLIMLWQALQAGWVPPTEITEQEYLDLKVAKPSALRGFAGFGSSFGGKWFGGYARLKPDQAYAPQDYVMNAHRATLRKIAAMQHVKFACASYTDLDPVKGSVIYCDPPYAGTTQYHTPFDSDHFWSVVREWARSCVVYVSEFTAPLDFKPIWTMPHETRLLSERKRIDTLEHVFVHERVT